MREVYAMNVAAMIGGAVLAVYGVWRWVTADRRQNPRHRLRRRGQIGCVGGASAVVLGLTFALTPQSWGDAVLLAWGCGTALLWLLNEWLSPR